MSPKIKLQLITLFTAFLFFSFSTASYSQGGLLGKLKKKAEDALNRKVDSVANRILDPKKTDKPAESTTNSDKTTTTSQPTSNNNSSENAGKTTTTTQPTTNTYSVGNTVLPNTQTAPPIRPVNSEIKDEDLIQHKPTAPKSGNTRYRIAKNLYIDMKGKYPSGYMPKWRFINYYSTIKFALENWIVPTASVQYDTKNIWIGDYKGKAVIRFKPHFNCECYADILVKDSVSVIDGVTQTYELGNFTSILNDRATGEPCVGGLQISNSNSKGGKMTLSTDENGDMKMDFMLEYYTAPQRNVNVYNKETKKKELIELVPPRVSYRYSAKNILVDNEMSAKAANDILSKELEAKRIRKEYLENSKKQIAELMTTIAQKYPQKDCRECYVRERSSGLKVTPTKTFYTDGYGNVYSESSSDWDISSKLYIQNKCNYKITFVGIKQLYQEGVGYYFTDVTATLDANYEYFVEQGMFSLLLTSMVGNNSDIYLQKEYDISSATVNSIQWIKVIRK